MSDKDQALAELEAAQTGFRAQLAGLPEDAYQDVWLGEWNLNQLLAHMSGWFREMTGGFERVARGERPTPEDYSDADKWNAGFAAHARVGPDALADFDDAYGGYLAAAKALPDDQYGVDPEKGRPRIGNRLLQASGIGHFEEHRPQLDEWLKARGSAG